jgi:hypothetical protein
MRFKVFYHGVLGCGAVGAKVTALYGTQVLSIGAPYWLHPSSYSTFARLGHVIQLLSPNLLVLVELN